MTEAIYDAGFNSSRVLGMAPRAFRKGDTGEDFEGGEFVLTEQRPRMQSKASVVPLRQGDAVVFTVHHRPVRGTRGIYRVTCVMA